MRIAIWVGLESSGVGEGVLSTGFRVERGDGVLKNLTNNVAAQTYWLKRTAPKQKTNLEKQLHKEEVPTSHDTQKRQRLASNDHYTSTTTSLSHLETTHGFPS